MKIHPQKIFLLLINLFILLFVNVLSQEDTLGITFDKKIESIEIVKQKDLDYLKSNVLKFYGSGFLHAEYYCSLEKIIKSKFTIETFLGLTIGEDKLGKFHSTNTFYSYKPSYQLENSHKPQIGFISKIGLKYYFGKYSLNGPYMASQVGFKTFNSKAFKRQNGTSHTSDFFTTNFSKNKRNTIEARFGGGYLLNLNHFHFIKGFLKNIVIDGTIGVQFEKDELQIFTEKQMNNNIYTYNMENFEDISFFPFISSGIGCTF